MWAHQILEDLNKTIPHIRQYYPNDIIHFEMVKDLLQQSFYFHMGKSQHWDLLLNNLIGKTVFMDSVIGCRMPFDKCVFEYLNESGIKVTIVAQKLQEDLFMAFCLTCGNTQTSSWFLLPYLLFVSPGIMLNKRTDLGQFPLLGGIKNDSNIAGFRLGYFNEYYQQDHFQGFAADMATDAKMLWYFLTLLNARNVKLSSIAPSAKLNKKRAKKGKPPLREYKRLLIYPFHKKKDEGYVIGDSQLQQRMHLTRGHFKYYTPERPLFGKLTGIYWWKPHVRGNEEKGIVNKEYGVKMPSQLQ